MRLTVSYRTRRELLIQIIPRYREAKNKQKKSILDEFVASTKYSRKYAIRLLCSKKTPLSKEIKRPRAKYYGILVRQYGNYNRRSSFNLGKSQLTIPWAT